MWKDIFSTSLIFLIVATIKCGLPNCSGQAEAAVRLWGLLATGIFTIYAHGKMKEQKKKVQDEQSKKKKKV